MRLSSKIFLYTFVTTTLVGICIISYFVVLLPGLYVDHKYQSYVSMIETSQKMMRDQTGCDATMTQQAMLIQLNVVLPKKGDTFELCSNYVSALVEPTSKETKALVASIKHSFENTDADLESMDFVQKEDLVFFEELMEPLLKNTHFEVLESTFAEPLEFNKQAIQSVIKTRDNIMILSSEASNQNHQYAVFMGMSESSTHYYLTLASSMTPELNELGPIIMKSTPMIIAVVIFLALVISRWFSKQLATPIEMLAQQARMRHGSQALIFSQPNKNDEFKALEDALNEMHQHLQAVLKAQSEKHEALIQSKETERVFLMSASHHLKTPISAALLLVESMMHRIGKYADTAVYLPKVQDELMRMKEIVESMLVLFEERRDIVIEPVEVDAVVETLLIAYQAQFEAKQLTYELKKEPWVLDTDRHLMTSILDNLLVNACDNAPHGSSIHIEVTEGSLKMSNEGTIPEAILNKTKEPFVTTHAQGSGLGLYLVDLTVEMLDLKWDIRAENNEVTVTIYR